MTSVTSAGFGPHRHAAQDATRRSFSGRTSMSLSRRALLKASAASAVLGGIGGVAAPHVARAQAAEFSYKFANNLPESHPFVARAREMAAAIKAETNGRFEMQVFPNSQLGS